VNVRLERERRVGTPQVVKADARDPAPFATASRCASTPGKRKRERHADRL
jgi:hypothetical protein